MYISACGEVLGVQKSFTVLGFYIYKYICKEDECILAHLPHRLWKTSRRSARLQSWTRGTKLAAAIAPSRGLILNTYWKAKSAHCSSKSGSVVAAVSRVRRSTAHIICWINSYQIRWNIKLQNDTVWLKIQKLSMAHLHSWFHFFFFFSQIYPKLTKVFFQH